ncbi:hypothetical protein BJX61DRAFT_483390 [Aspergillus egyptiacus]|nr:hypothetical protein BJX61DRAFT_483390 [Aspergillus egyptiacus]
MESGPSITALVSGPVGQLQDESDKPSSTKASQQERGDNNPDSAGDSTPPNPAVPKSPEESRDKPALNGASNGPAPETGQEKSNVGDKRELEATPAANTNDASSSKKQKTSENHPDASNSSSVAARTEDDNNPSQTSTEKKKGGRPRKTKVSVRKDIPTDGIGSRTRSRTKVVS